MLRHKVREEMCRALGVSETGLKDCDYSDLDLMITGFDEEKKTLIFSDSWGAAHTEKEMPLADAIAITTGRQVMQPSK